MIGHSVAGYGMPLISVVITCYNRKKFLLSALESLANQTAPQDDFEVIVVKNVIDETIDSFIFDHGYKTVFIEDGPVGEFLLAGISESNGEIISFLDGDDRFTEEKISSIKQFFQEEDVIYLHNGHSPIDENDNLLRRTVHENIRVSRNLKIDDQLDIDRILREDGIHDIGALFFNLSSTSVRKDIMLKSGEYLKDLTARTDDFVFYSCLKHGQGKTMVVNSEILTLYRRHSSTSNPGKQIAKQLEMLKGIRIGSEFMQKMMQNTKFSKYPRCQAIIDTIEISRVEGDLLQYLKSGRSYYQCMKTKNYTTSYIARAYLMGFFQARLPRLHRILEKISFLLDNLAQY